MKSYLSTIISGLIIAILITSSLWGQTPTHSYIPPSAIGNVFPFGSTTSNRSQYLYLPSDFTVVPNTPGLINKVYFRSASTIASTVFTNFTVKIAHSALTSMTTGPWISPMTTVYSGNITFTNVTNGGWVEVPLQTTFLYDGSSNLIVEFSQTGYTSGITGAHGDVPNRRLYGNVTATTGTVQQRLLGFGFDMAPASCSGAPTAGTVSTSANLVDCKDSVALEVTGHSTLQGVTLQWQYNNSGSWVNFGNGTAQTMSPAVSIPTSFRVLATCTSPGGTTSSSNAVMVVPNPIPISLGNDTFVCLNTQLTLSPNLSSGTFLWDNNTTGGTRNVSAAGTYFVTYTDTEGCIGSDTIVVTNISAPSANMRTVHLIDRRWLFEATSPNAATELVEWDFGDGSPLASGFSVNHTYQSNGTFLVTMYAQNKCDESDISKKAIVVNGFGESISIKELIENSNIKIYPNPASEQIKIDNPDLHHIMNVTIVDNTGRTLISSNIEQKLNSIPLDISKLPKGQFIAIISTQQGSVTLPLIKQ